MNKIGNEYHFITECDNTIICKFRNDRLKSISAVMPQFTKLQNESIFLYIMLCSDKNLIEYFSKFICNSLKDTNQL